MLLRSITLGVWFLLGPAVAQTSSGGFNVTVNQIDPNTCVAPGDYIACNDLAITAETQCINEASIEAIKDGCACAGFIQQINCFASACWNRIYGCEYQSLVANYAGLCQLIMTLPVPYWPAPDNAPGSCSCNTGEILEAYLGLQVSELSCAKNSESLSLGDIPARLEACACCGTGITISAIYDICPNTDPKLIGLDTLLNAVAPYYPWPECVDSLNQYNCVADLDFEPPLSTGAVYNPTNLPASGTQSLTNIAGEVTSPASGSIFSYTAIGQEWTVTALSINAFEVATTSQASATNTRGAGTVVGGTVTGGTVTGGTVVTGTSGTVVGGKVTGGTVVTGTSAGSPATTTKSGAKKTTLRLFSLLASAILCGVVMSL